MKIAFGCDPNAALLKQELIDYTSKLGHTCFDLGSDDPIYANVAISLAKEVADGVYDRGVLICGTGIGVSISANKVKGAYCALVNNIYQARRAQLSNNANIIALGSQVTGSELAKLLLGEYLSQLYNPSSRSEKKIARIAEFEKSR